MDNETNVFPGFATPPAPMFEDAPQTASDPGNGRRSRATGGRGGKTKPVRRVHALTDPDKKKRKPRGARRVMPATTIQPGPVAQVAAAVERGERKRKARQPRQAKTRETQVAISLLPALIGLKPEELSFVLQVGDAFKALGKKGRERVGAALVRMCQ